MGQKCSNCGADFESPEADQKCPKPSPGREYVDCGKGNHMFNAGHDSDYFAGLCPCNDYPCKRAVAAQKLLETEEKVRSDVYKYYWIHHHQYPQSAFIDSVIAAVRGQVNDEELNALYHQHLKESP